MCKGLQIAQALPRRDIHVPARALAVALAGVCLLLASAHAGWDKCESLGEGSFLSNTITAAAAQGAVVWVGTDKGLARSTNRGTDWEGVDLAAATPYSVLVQGAGAEEMPMWQQPVGRARRLRNLVTDIAVTGTDVWVATGLGVCLSRDGGRTWVSFGPKEGLPAGMIHAIAAEGKMAWATSTRGLYHSADRGRHWAALAPRFANGRAGFPAVMSTICVGTVGGSHTLWIGGFRTRPVRGGAELFRSRDQGRSWTPVATGAGAEPGDAAQPAAYRVRVINENVWVAGPYGLSLSHDNGKTWKTFNRSHGLPADEVWDVVKADKRLWAATDDGLCYSTDSGNTWLREPTVRGKTTRLAWDGAALWVGTPGGLLRRAPGGRVWSNFSNRSHVLCAAVTRERDVAALWVGTAGGLCKSLDMGRSWQAFTVAEGLPCNYVRDLSADGPTLWAATDGGVVRMGPGGAGWRVYGQAEGLRSNRVHQIAAARGIVWAATKAGLSRFAAGERRWRTFHPRMAWQRLVLTGNYLFAATYQWVNVQRVRAPSLTLTPMRKPFFHVLRVSLDGSEWKLLPVDGYAGGALYDMASIGGAVWLATETGLYRSSDEGETWARFDREVLWGRHVLRLAGGALGQLLLESRMEGPSSAPGILSATSDRGRTWSTVTGRLPGVGLALLAHGDALICGTRSGLYFNRTPQFLPGRPNYHSWLRLSHLAASRGRRDRMGTVAAIDPHGFAGPSLWIGSQDGGVTERGFPPVEGGFPGVYGGPGRWSLDPWVTGPRSAAGGGLLNNVIRSILCLPDGVWVGTPSGISVFDRIGGWRQVSIGLPESKSRDVRGIVRFGHELWIATGDGIAVLDRRSKTWRAIDSSNSPLPGEGVRCLATDGRSVWAGCEKGAFQFVPRPTDKGTAGRWHSLGLGERINQIAAGRKHVYLATDGGLYRYDKGRGHVRRYYRGNSTLDGNEITHVILHGREVWVSIRETSTVRKLFDDPEEPALVGAGGEAAPARAGPEHVVIVVNERSAGSMRVGEHYRGKRGVPRANVCRLRCAMREAVTRQEFEDQIRVPLWRFLKRTGLSRRAAFLVTTYGVPLRIRNESFGGKRPRNTDVNAASVDSELCVLARLHRQAGPLPNFYLYRDELFDPRRYGTFLVTRLDGPTPEVAMSLVDRALAAERSQSFDSAGRAYFDLDPPHNRGHALVDEPIEASYRYLSRQSRLRSRLVIERTGRPFNRPGEAGDAFFYLGWSGNKYRPEVFSWRPGAVGIHVNSFSAKSLRGRGSCWVPDALADGLTCTIGAVYEPLSAGVNAFDHLYRYLNAGYTWAESAYMSIRFHSWQTVVIGDPLYRPFRPRE